MSCSPANFPSNPVAQAACLTVAKNPQPSWILGFRVQGLMVRGAGATDEFGSRRHAGPYSRVFFARSLSASHGV